MDEEALIQTNSGLVYTQLHHFHMINDPDAESLAFEALLLAIRSHVSSKAKLSTYATVCIYNALCNYLRTKSREPETVSANMVIQTNHTTNDKVLELQDTFEDPCRTDDNIMQEELYSQLRMAFFICHEKLTNPKHIAIVDAWQDSEYTATTRAISKQVGVSQPYASEVLINFKANLKKKMEEYYVYSRNCT